MSFVKLTQDGQAVRRRRILINGAPNVRKTTACLTAPRPLAIVSMPGEKGYDTIPLNDPEVLPFIWEVSEGKQPDSSNVVGEVFNVSIDLITGKHGPVTTFVGDGIHKLIHYIIDDVTDGAWFAGAEFEPKLYALAYRKFEDYLSRVMHSQIPVVIFTCWDDDDFDRKKKPGERQSDVPTSIRPDLPGQLAKRILGEFSVVFNQTLRAPKPGADVVACWQTQADAAIKGASIKGPVAVVTRIPKFISADFRVFEAEWDKAEKAAKEESNT